MEHHLIGNLIDLCLFLGAILFGELFMQDFLHWLAYGHLPPWLEETGKWLPGALVAVYHIRKRKKTDNGNKKTE